jgi:hypothetical protein
MPIRDWSRIDPNLFDHFHQRWTTAICDALNGGVLPEGFSALIEQHAMGLVPDVLAVHRRSGNRPAEPKGGAVVATPPKIRHVFESPDQSLVNRANRVVVRHLLGDVVCMIEIVSPGNKSSKIALLSFVEKTYEFLRAGVNVLVIDLFPPTRRDPDGIHAVLWEPFANDEPFVLPAEKPLVVATYRAGDLASGWPMRAEVELVGVGDSLPDMPAYLDVIHHVPVPLEPTYQEAWITCPPDMRYLVEHGSLPGE